MKHWLVLAVWVLVAWMVYDLLAYVVALPRELTPAAAGVGGITAWFVATQSTLANARIRSLVGSPRNITAIG